VYSVLPLKKYICLFLRALPFSNEKYYRDLRFKGNFKVRVDGKKFRLHHCQATIENKLFWKGIDGWEKVSLHTWIKLCRESSVILDIGANTGIYSIVAATIKPQSKIFSFEPSKKTFEDLRANIRLNHFSNVYALNYAISNHSGEAVFYDFDAEHQYSASLNKDMFGAEVRRKELTVQIKSLDDFIEENSLTKIDLIKLDVEMHEPEVLEGFRKYLSHFRPTILIEVLNDDMAKRLSILLDGLNYFYFDISEESVPEQIFKLQKSSGFNLLICEKQICDKLGLKYLPG